MAEGAVATTVGLDDAAAARLAEAFSAAASASEHASAEVSPATEPASTN